MKKPTCTLAVCCLFYIAVNAQNTWAPKSNFAGIARMGAVAFSIGNMGYVGTGGDFSGGNYFNDFWEYDPVTDSWTQKANFQGNTRYRAVGFGVGSKGYIGTGYNGTGFNDWWEYDPASNSWTQKANMGTMTRFGGTGFVIGNNIYCGTGYDGGGYAKDYWKFNTLNNTWTQVADYGGQPIIYGTGFSIGAHGYTGTGVVLTPVQTAVNDFWQYDTTSNTWTQKASYAGGIRSEAVGFSIGNYGYIATGTSNWGTGAMDDCWIYDPVNDNWSAMAAFPGGDREEASVFVIGCKAYVGTGFINDNSGTLQNDFWELSNCSAAPSAAFSVSDTSICEGDCIDFFDLSLNGPLVAWQWSFPGASTTVSTAQHPTSICYPAAGTYDVTFIVCNLIGCDTIILSNFITVTAKPSVNLGNDTTICAGDTLVLAGPGPQYAYQWQDGTTNTTYTVTGAGIYWVQVEQNGCSVYDTVTINTQTCSFPSVAFASSDTILCEKNCIDFFDLSTNNPTQWQWYFTGAQPDTSSLQHPTNICYNSYGTYPVTLVASNANGSDSVTVSTFITVIQSPPTPLITVNFDTLFSTPAYSYQWFFGSTAIPGATGPFYVYNQAGYYYVIVGDTNGCLTASAIFDLTAIPQIVSGGSLQVFPNPVSGDITVILPAGLIAGKATLKITNMSAELVKEETIDCTPGNNRITIGTAPLATGHYVLSVEAGSRHWKKILLVE